MRALALLVPGFLVAALATAGEAPTPAASGGSLDLGSCGVCHAAIDDMHPAAALTCVDCHGGDPEAETKEEAHVRPRRGEARDERVAPADEDLAWRRFVNPMDLRVAEETCGDCHAELVEHLRVSLHGTTAGHLSDGFYEIGELEERGSRFGVFPVESAPREGGAVEELVQVPAMRTRSRTSTDLRDHYADLARKECMQCHLWSEGRAVRGRVGFDGDYRGEGCAACHVPYELDGLSRSADPTVPKREPGHPREHRMTRAPTTQTCTSCHYGDASIGLHFRGLSQLPPGAPGGPEIPGTTDAQLNRVFYLDDPEVVPPDLHHERGMHCIDCHTLSDVMGDGRLHGHMEHAVEISCSACHGTFDEPATLLTERGTPLEHLRREGDEVILTSKVDGREHRVVQVTNVVDPRHRDYSPRGADAMTGEHANVECYTCHAGWNVNFLGFHFTRNESLTQLDLLSGRRTPGRVTTQEKVFATWKSFYAGLNEAGRVAPYLTGFSTMGSVFDEDGEVVLDQVLPQTAAGLSGLTMIHHQLHSTRPTARSCVECHRAPATWGLGSANFRLGRRFAYAADRRGIEVVALRRERLADSLPLAKLPLADVVALALDGDPIQGHGRTLFAAEGARGIHSIDVSDPTSPRRVDFLPLVQPRGMQLAGEHLYVADGVGGLVVVDVSDPAAMRIVGRQPTFDAHAVQVAWPWAYVADGPGGLAIVDVRAPIAPRVLTAIDVNGPSKLPNDVTHVTSLFQYSRPRARDGRPIDRRTPARHLCALLDQRLGVVLVDVTEPSAPEVVFPDLEGRGSDADPELNASWRGLALVSHVDLAEEQGGSRTVERDYLYALAEVARNNIRSALVVVDVTEPRRPRQVARAEAGYATESLTTLAVYNEPFVQRMLLASGERGIYVTDASVSAEPNQIGTLGPMRDVYALAVEEFPLDRMVTETGEPLKDVSHEGSRWFRRSELERVLTVPAEELGLGPAVAAFGGSALAHLEQSDADGSGRLEGEELARAGASFDLDGDGRIFLVELAEHIGLLSVGASDASTPVVVVGEDRGSSDGDLARLLDLVDPWSLDEDGDGRLDERELERGVFLALDLDRDGALTPGELSRAPGAPRELRYGDARGAAVFEDLDDNRDGVLSRRELELRAADLQALDDDRDGAVSLPDRLPERARASGLTDDSEEWPSRRRSLSLLPPGVTVERLLGTFDGDGDGELSVRELRRRPDLVRVLDRDRDGRATEAELRESVDRAARLGLEGVADGFVPRWDLDGDGEVAGDELPEWAWSVLEHRRRSAVRAARGSGASPRRAR